MTIADDRLSAIPTMWSMVRHAHDSQAESARAAQQHLLALYGGAARRYLLAALRDEDAADEVFQEFALRFVQGSFQQVCPDRGRFRSFLKTCLYHLIIDYQRRRKKQRATSELEYDAMAVAGTDGTLSEDTLYIKCWREELLMRAWQRLAEDEASTGKPYHTVLRMRAENATASSTELAEVVTLRLGKEISSANVRVIVHRARELFSEVLLNAVIESLPDSRRGDVEEELIELQLLEYCRAGLQRQAASTEE